MQPAEHFFLCMWPSDAFQFEALGLVYALKVIQQFCFLHFRSFGFFRINEKKETVSEVKLLRVGEVYFEWDYFENGYFETVISNSISKRQFRKKFTVISNSILKTVISKKWWGTWSTSYTVTVYDVKVTVYDVKVTVYDVKVTVYDAKKW